MIFSKTSPMQKVVYVVRNVVSGLGLGPLFFLVDIVATLVKKVRNWIDQRSTNPTQTTIYNAPDDDETITPDDNDVGSIPESISSEQLDEQQHILIAPPSLVWRPDQAPL